MSLHGAIAEPTCATWVLHVPDREDAHTACGDDRLGGLLHLCEHIQGIPERLPDDAGDVGHAILRQQCRKRDDGGAGLRQDQLGQLDVGLSLLRDLAGLGFRQGSSSSLLRWGLLLFRQTERQVPSPHMSGKPLHSREQATS